MDRDPWHYPRTGLAEQFLRRFNPGPAQALTLFAERRAGKTAFLQNDLAPAAIAAKLQPVYIDLWAHRADPGRAIADGLEAAARKVRDPNYKYGSILGRFDDQVTSLGAFGVSVGMKGRTEAQGPDDTISRIGFWADQLVSGSKRPILLMVDEVQSLASAGNGGDVASALRSTLQKHGRQALQPVFTGSSRDGLQRLFNQTNAAFYRYGSNMDFPAPDDGIAKFFADRLRESSGIRVPEAELLRAFNELDRRPGPFREMVEAMDNAAEPNVEKYLQRQIGEMQAMAYTRADLAKLKPLDVAVLEQILTGDGELFGRESKAAIASRIGVDSVNPKSLTDSLNKLRDLGMVTRVDRGDYRIEDRDVETLLLGQNLVGPPAPKALPAPAAGEAARAGETYRGTVRAIEGDRVTQEVAGGRLVEHSKAQLYKLGGGLGAALQPGKAVAIEYGPQGLGRVTDAAEQGQKQGKKR